MYCNDLIYSVQKCCDQGCTCGEMCVYPVEADIYTYRPGIYIFFFNFKLFTLITLLLLCNVSRAEPLHLANFTVCARIASCTILFTLQYLIIISSVSLNLNH